MPFTYIGYEFNYSYQSGIINLSNSLSTATGTITNPGTQIYKVVVIPAGIIKTNINTHNYVDVKAAYNLKD